MLPQELQRDTKADRRRLKHIAPAAMAAVLLAACGMFWFHTDALNREIAAAEIELARRQGELAAAAGGEIQRRQEQLALQNFQYLLEKRQAWLPLLESLDAALPVDVWLERISLLRAEPDGPDGTVQAEWQLADTMVVDGYSRTVASVGVFMFRLGQTPGLEQITLNEIREEQKYAAYKFKITAALRGSGG